MTIDELDSDCHLLRKGLYLLNDSFITRVRNRAGNWIMWLTICIGLCGPNIRGIPVITYSIFVILAISIFLDIIYQDKLYYRIRKERTNE